MIHNINGLISQEYGNVTGCDYRYRYLVPGTGYLVPGTWYLVPGTQVFSDIYGTRAVRAYRDYNDPRLRVTVKTWRNKMRVVQQYTR